MIDAARIALYQFCADRGRPPTAAELAAACDADIADIRRALAELDARHIINLDARGEIWKAGPFTCASTAHRVIAGEQTWDALCAWDALAIPATLGRAATVASRCAHTGAPITVAIFPENPPGQQLSWTGDGWIAHFLVPAARWYDDLAFT